MSDLPSLSVLMAVHNGLPYIREALDSLFAQTYQDFELVIVDDASTDGTAAMIAEYSAKSDKIRCFRNPVNLGLASSLNLGIDKCRAQLIARADADDVFMPERLGEQIAYMDLHPEVGVLGTSVEFIDCKSMKIHSTKAQYPQDHEHLRFLCLTGCCFWHTTVMYRKSIIQSVGGYDILYSKGPEDYDLWARLIGLTVFANLQEPLAHQRLHQKSITANWDHGFNLYCGVSCRLMSEWLHRPVSMEDSISAVVLSGWEKPMDFNSCRRGLALMRELRNEARHRGLAHVLPWFKRKWADCLVRQSEISVYSDRRACILLVWESLTLDPRRMLSSRIFNILMRVWTPVWFRNLIRLNRVW